MSRSTTTLQAALAALALAALALAGLAIAQPAAASSHAIPMVTPARHRAQGGAQHTPTRPLSRRGTAQGRIGAAPQIVATPPQITTPRAVDVATTDPRFGIVQAADKPEIANGLGARWSRIGFMWNYIQPTGPQSWNPWALSSQGSDSVINAEIARNRAIVGLLGSAPAWAAKYATWGTASMPVNVDHPWRPPASADLTKVPATANTNYWANYAYALAKHYAGRINAWIIWNEVSIPATPSPSGECAPGSWTQWYGGQSCPQTPAGSVPYVDQTAVANYARLVRAADRAIKAANPSATVVLYGDPYWDDKGAFFRALMATLHTMAQSPAPHDPPNATAGYFDVANLHLYIGAPSFYWIIGDMRKQLARYGWTDKQIWVSETNVEPYDDPAHQTAPVAFRAALEEQAGFLVDAFSVDIAAKADRIEVYRMFDNDALAPLGLINSHGQKRPVAYTYRFLVTLFKDATAGSFTTGEFYQDGGRGGSSGVFKVVTYKPGYRITTLWNQMGAHARYPKLYAQWDHHAMYTPDPSVKGAWHDAHDDIVLPLREQGPRGTSYDAQGTATYHLQTTARTAVVYDKYGTGIRVTAGGPAVEINNRGLAGAVRPVAIHTTIQLRGGVYTVQLRGGDTYSNPDDPRIPTEGGDPVIIIEPR